MHMPDGFMTAPASVGAGIVAAAGIALCVKGARRELDERAAPLAGLTAAFIFAAQMINFPVAGGTSGHLLGGALAAILIGPYTGALAVTTVLLVQTLLFADGGITAFGFNTINMALVTVLVGWLAFRGLARLRPRSRTWLVVSAGIAGFLSVPAAAIAFTVEYALGGTATFSVGQVFVSMVGVHALIGIGEGVITALTVGAVLAARPDLVRGSRDLLAPALVTTSPASSPGSPAPASPPGSPVPAASASPASSTPPAPAAGLTRREDIR